MPTPIHRTSTIKKRLISYRNANDRWQTCSVGSRATTLHIAVITSYEIRRVAVPRSRKTRHGRLRKRLVFATPRTFNSYDCRRPDTVCSIVLIVDLAGPLPCGASSPTTEFETERCPTNLSRFHHIVRDS